MFIEVTTSLLEGFLKSFEIFGLTLLFALPLGLIICFGSRSRIKVLRIICRFIVWVIRGTPLMLQLIVIYYGPGLVGHWASAIENPNFLVSWLAGWSVFDRFVAVMIAFVINYACYFSEIYRGGIDSIPQGQYEAGQVLGFTRAQTFFYIILPQVCKRVLLPVTNEVITLVKDTALASTVAVSELMNVAKKQVSGTSSIEPYVVAMIIYLILNGVAEQVCKWVERKMNYYK